MSDQQALLCPSTVRGYSLKDKCWMDFDIDKVRDEFADDLSDTLDDQNIENFVILSNPQVLFSRPGELKVRYEALDGHEVTILAGNTDWDSDAEFELELAGHYVLTDNDFYRA